MALPPTTVPTGRAAVVVTFVVVRAVFIAILAVDIMLIIVAENVLALPPLAALPLMNPAANPGSSRIIPARIRERASSFRG